MVRFEKEIVKRVPLDFNDKVGDLIKNTNDAYGKDVPIKSSKEVWIQHENEVYNVKLEVSRVETSIHNAEAKLVEEEDD